MSNEFRKFNLWCIIICPLFFLKKIISSPVSKWWVVEDVRHFPNSDIIVYTGISYIDACFIDLATIPPEPAPLLQTSVT